MNDTVLITGGAGFIGRALANELGQRGHRVRILDALIDQVHGADPVPPPFPEGTVFIRGDVRDRAAVEDALTGATAVVHLAAEVGVGQSMYAIERYTSVNDTGTAVLFEAMIDKPIRRVVTASSMSIYGEGLYEDADGNPVHDVKRDRAAGGSWDPTDDQGRSLRPVPTPESKRPALASVYAIGKYVQERLTLTLAEAYGYEGVALRLWNVYGPGQALSNPYTGVLAIFASRIANGQSPMIFEDGEQRRDFVHVRDVARAFADALEMPGISGKVFNIASGTDRSVSDVATALARAMGSDLTARVTGEGRTGDIRHCIADISAARSAIGFEAREDFDAGLAELAEWVAQQEAQDRVDAARDELKARGLVS
ncbi:dTDP-L-rhamnose 4-epimerase [Sphingomonas jejuensis]|uniref:dTDP-L-rhamnose 4-epimerase n=1 Tax=Sphingomonas jejuensis TaxID=904715 RepID=A0ABX0XKW6_9SPHN|nr:NAD-dependent epimerase/dehydratase family protein [Sphingomonas jejuensis]NJC34008.1 dTDP-L-rhamnose 4-epimerase [Sphingomonas jejuensis]